MTTTLAIAIVILAFLWIAIDMVRGRRSRLRKVSSEPARYEKNVKLVVIQEIKEIEHKVEKQCAELETMRSGMINLAESAQGTSSGPSSDTALLRIVDGKLMEAQRLAKQKAETNRIERTKTRPHLRGV